MKRLLAPLVLVLLATACSAPAESSAPAEVAPTPVVMGPGEYTWENDTGAKGTITIPGKPDPEIEKLRAIVKAKPTTYITVKVDNRQGTEPVTMHGISIFTPEGEELQYTTAYDYVGAVTPADAPAEVYNRFIEEGNKHNDPANPKAVKEFVMTGPALPETFTAVTVYPTGGFDPVDALPAS